jgi:hypothetical protein
MAKMAVTLFDADFKERDSFLNKSSFGASEVVSSGFARR